MGVCTLELVRDILELYIPEELLCKTLVLCITEELLCGTKVVDMEVE